MTSVDDEWQQFLSEDNTYDHDNENIELEEEEEIPKHNNYDDGSTELYISTKSKIAYLSEKKVDIYKIFWELPIIPYTSPVEGFVKKEIKINCSSQKETDENNVRLSKVGQHFKNEDLNANRKTKNLMLLPHRSVYRDIRKISIGLSKKDIMSNIKKKSAFFNCFVILTRLCINDVFREFHVKVFNTGKLELPGIKEDAMFEVVLDKVVVMLKPFIHADIWVDKSNITTVLINSDFNCGFFIKRDKLTSILRNKYNIPSIYDPCTYQGIKCKYEFHENNKKEVVNFMIFRTGSVLVVGKCVQETLYKAYQIIKTILETEKQHIRQSNVTEVIKSKHDRLLKVVKKRKIITLIK
jgi:TATA-box binding protein (TBP) (component of TFIID and TFIIIB)